MGPQAPLPRGYDPFVRRRNKCPERDRSVRPGFIAASVCALEVCDYTPLCLLIRSSALTTLASGENPGATAGRRKGHIDLQKLAPRRRGQMFSNGPPSAEELDGVDSEVHSFLPRYTEAQCLD